MAFIFRASSRALFMQVCVEEIKKNCRCNCIVHEACSCQADICLNEQFIGQGNLHLTNVVISLLTDPECVAWMNLTDEVGVFRSNKAWQTGPIGHANQFGLPEVMKSWYHSVHPSILLLIAARPTFTRFSGFGAFVRINVAITDESVYPTCGEPHSYLLASAVC